MKLTKTIALVLALVLCIGLFSGCAASGYTAKNTEFVIGLSGPLTGGASVYGVAVKNSAQMAVDEINAANPDGIQLAWQAARPNAIVTVVALYDKPQMLPLPEMYGKNLTFKTGGVDGCDCEEILSLIEQGLIDTTPLITHRYRLEDIEEAYHLFENKEDNVIKVAIY